MNTIFRTNRISQAVAGAMLLALIGCSGGADHFGATGAATPSTTEVATLTGSVLMDRAIRTGGDFEMVDALHAEHVAAPQAVARADARLKETARTTAIK